MSFWKHNKQTIDGVLAGLGRLTISPKSGAASKEAKRVVAAFIRGEKARGSCRVGAGPKDCGITTDGKSLMVGGYTLATKKASGLEVCVPSKGTMITEGKKVVEAENSKDIKATATALLRGVGAGIGVKTDRQGIRRILGAKGKSAALVPDACLQVQMSKKQLKVAAAGAEASERAAKKFGVEYPTQTQLDAAQEELERERESTRNVKRKAALEKARASRKARAPKATAPEAPPAPPVEPPKPGGLISTEPGPGLVKPEAPPEPPRPPPPPPAPPKAEGPKRRRMLIVDVDEPKPQAPPPAGGLINKGPGPGLVKPEQPVPPPAPPPPEPPKPAAKPKEMFKPKVEDAPDDRIVVPDILIGRGLKTEIKRDEDGFYDAKAFLGPTPIYWIRHPTEADAIVGINNILKLYARRYQKQQAQ